MPRTGTTPARTRRRPSARAIFCCADTHIPRCAEHEGFVYMNPGSISLPKAGSERSYMVYENGRFAWKRLEDGTVYQEYSI